MSLLQDNNDDDDMLLSSGDDWHHTDEHASAEDDIRRDLRTMQQRMSKEGYRDAHEAGKEQALQVAFDEGFKAGGKQGWETGVHYGSVSAAAWALGDETPGPQLHELKAKFIRPATKGIYTEDNGELLDEYSSVMSIALDAAVVQDPNVDV
jgi:flagellar biosynthesis/type III secretory pathway protein FliH